MVQIRRRKKNKGFTLPEAILSTAMLAFVFTAILTVTTNCVVLGEASRNSSVAASHVQFILEDIKHTDFANISSNISAGTWDWDSADLTSEGLTPLNNETITTTATGSNLLNIIVTVAWRDTQQRDRSMAIETLISG